jgi:hypothetical protein
MSNVDPNVELAATAAARQDRINRAAVARQMVKEASDDDSYTDYQRHSAFGRLLSWLRRRPPGV